MGKGVHACAWRPGGAHKCAEACIRSQQGVSRRGEPAHATLFVPASDGVALYAGRLRQIIDKNIRGT